MIELLVVDDHPVVRQGIRTMLSDAQDIVIGDEAVNGFEALDKIREREWHAVLLDLSMPGMDGLDVLKQVRIEKPALPVLVMSIQPEDQFALRALRAGASGYVTKSSAPEELRAAIRTVAGGGHFVSAWLASRLAREVSTGASDHPHEQLSDREYQVMLRIASGRTAKEIAEELSLSPKTVGTYRLRLGRKMGLTSDAEFTAYAFRHRLLV
jgi:DNA-binding NarL/FixJ family response regulator